MKTKRKYISQCAAIILIITMFIAQTNVYGESATDVPDNSISDELSDRLALSDSTPDSPDDSISDSSVMTDDSDESVQYREIDLSEAVSYSLSDSSTSLPSDISIADLSLSDDPLPLEETVGASEGVAEGLYAFRIMPDGSTTRMLAVKNNSLENHADMIIGTSAKSNVRLFYIEKVTGTYYRIRSLHTGKCVQVVCNKTANGTKIRQNSQSTTTALQWQFIKTGSGYRIIGRNSQKALTVSGGLASAGTPLEIRTFSGKPSQIWYLTPSQINISGAGTALEWPSSQAYSGSPIKPDVNLTVYGRKLTNGKDYTLTYENNTEIGTASITVKGKGNYSGEAKGTFAIRNYKRTVESGSTYYLVPKTDESLCIGVAGNTIQNNAKLNLIKRSNVKYKRITILKTSDGRYKILTGNPLYALTANNENLKIYKQQNDASQRFKMVKDSGGAFSIVNASSDLAITMSGSGTSGSTLFLSEQDGSDLQKFYLQKSTAVFPQSPAYIQQYNNTYVNDISIEANITLNSIASKVSIFKQSSTTTDGACSGAFVDFKNAKIGMYKGFVPGNQKEVLIEKKIPFTLKAKQTYKVKLIRTCDCIQAFTLENPSTGDSVTVQDSFTNTGRAWGKIQYNVDFGSVSVSNFNMISLANTFPVLAIIGDSYIGGFSLSNNISQRYATLISDYLDKDVYLCAKGGADSTSGVNWLNQYVFETVRPKYMLIAFGMNDKNYDTWLSNTKKMIALVEANGIIPILATVPPTNSSVSVDYSAEHLKMSEWVKSSGYRYLDIAKVLSMNGDGETFNPDLIKSDGIHPTVNGHCLIFEEFVRNFGDLKDS